MQRDHLQTAERDEYHDYQANSRPALHSTCDGYTLLLQTSDTSVQSFETAAELLKLGADAYEISRRNIFVKSKGRRMIEDFLKDSLHFSCDDRLITGIITLHNLGFQTVSEVADICDDVQ